LVFDFITRNRLVGLHLDYHVFAQNPLPLPEHFTREEFSNASAGFLMPHSFFSPHWLRLKLSDGWRHRWAITPARRVELQCSIEAMTALHFGLDLEQLRHMLPECDYDNTFVRSRDSVARLNPKGFWRVDKEKPPEQRLTVLSLVAFDDLQQQIASSGGDVERGIEAFCSQNDGEGWLLPETLRLSDYGLGHDDRAREPQPVRACFGPRFYDWQLAQSPAESWRECHLHARNLLGPDGYQALLDELEGRTPPPDQLSPPGAAEPDARQDRQGQLLMFETEQHPLFDQG
jgi:hypothetical protein